MHIGQIHVGSDSGLVCADSFSGAGKMIPGSSESPPRTLLELSEVCQPLKNLTGFSQNQPGKYIWQVHHQGQIKNSSWRA